MNVHPSKVGTSKMREPYIYIGNQNSTARKSNTSKWSHKWSQKEKEI